MDREVIFVFFNKKDFKEFYENFWSKELLLEFKEDIEPFFDEFDNKYYFHIRFKLKHYYDVEDYIPINICFDKLYGGLKLFNERIDFFKREELDEIILLNNKHLFKDKIIEEK